MDRGKSRVRVTKVIFACRKTRYVAFAIEKRSAYSRIKTMKTGRTLAAVVAAWLSGGIVGMILGREEGAKARSRKLKALAAELNEKVDRRLNELRSCIDGPHDRSETESSESTKSGMAG